MTGLFKRIALMFALFVVVVLMLNQFNQLEEQPQYRYYKVEYTCWDFYGNLYCERGGLDVISEIMLYNTTGDETK